jgi:hypothetical protein
MNLPATAPSASRRSPRWIAARLRSAGARLHGRWRPRVTAQPRDDESRGQGIVEFALVVSLLLLILFGIIDFSRLFFAYATMANGVREGARYGVVHSYDELGIKERAHAMMVLIGDEANVTVAFPDTDEDGDGTVEAGEDGHCSHNCRVVVTATSDLDVWTPIIPSVRILAQSTMHIE